MSDKKSLGLIFLKLISNRSALFKASGLFFLKTLLMMLVGTRSDNVEFECNRWHQVSTGTLLSEKINDDFINNDSIH